MKWRHALIVTAALSAGTTATALVATTIPAFAWGGAVVVDKQDCSGWSVHGEAHPSGTDSWTYSAGASGDWSGGSTVSGTGTVTWSDSSETFGYPYSVTKPGECKAPSRPSGTASYECSVANPGYGLLTAMLNPDGTVVVSWGVRIPSIGIDIDGTGTTSISQLLVAIPAGSTGWEVYLNGSVISSGSFVAKDCSPPPADIEVTAGVPTSNDVCGTNADTYTIPSTTGVVYKVGGAVKAAGTYPGSGSVTVTAEATTGYKLIGDSSWTLAFTDVACPVPDIDITVTGLTSSDLCGTASDTYTLPAIVGVVYKVGGVVTAAGTYPGTGTVNVTAEATSGYHLVGGSTWTLVFTNDACPVVLTPSTPSAPTSVDQCGTDADQYTIPATVGVDYLVNGELKMAGTYPGTGTVTVVAQQQAGYHLVGTTSWTFAFTNVMCFGGPPPRLPSTGAATWIMMLFGIGFCGFGALLLIPNRRRRML
jgi:hypothetical protein